MPLETHTIQTRRAAKNSETKTGDGSPPQALIQEIATRRYFGHRGEWTDDFAQATDFRSAAAALEHVRQLKFVMVQLVLTGNLAVCEVIPSATADNG